MSSMSRKDFLVRAAGAGVAVLGIEGYLAAGGAWGRTLRSDARTLVVGLNSDVSSLDPHRALGWTTMLVTLTMGEHLVTEDLSRVTAGPPKLVPRLAQSYDVSADGKTYTFHLRPGVKFHDGTPFNAAAVEFNIRRQWDKSFKYYYAPAAGISFWDYQFLKSIKTPDDATVVLQLSQPWPEFLRMSSQSWGQQFMISPTQIMKVGNDHVGDHPMLTGPYRYVSRDPGSKIVVEANPDYWGKKAASDRIIFQPMADTPTRISALTSGQIDIAQDPLPASSKSTITGAGASISTASSPYLLFMSMNLKDPITKNKLVRQAIETAIDKAAMVKSLYGDWATPAASMLPANSPSYDPAFRGRAYSPKVAKALLAKAGHADGFSTHMLIDQTYEDIAQWIQRDLAQVGIEVTLDNVDFVTFGGQWGAGLKSPQTMTFAGWGMTADYWIDIMTRSTRQPPHGTNIAGYDNPAVDALLNRAQVSLDQSVRTRLYRRVGAILHEDLPHIPLLNFKQPTGVRKGLSVVRPHEDWYDVSYTSV